MLGPLGAWISWLFNLLNPFGKPDPKAALIARMKAAAEAKKVV